jgi:peptidoglycan/LPS O-acetylase OafA/YrhL
VTNSFRLGAKTEFGRRNDIQGLRSVAVLSVIAFHVGLPIPGGFVGVDIFFVISGLVITRLLVSRSMEDMSIAQALKQFYIRRIRRIIPALGFVILAVTGVSFLLESPWGEQARTAKSALASFGIFANLYYAVQDNGYFSLGAKTNPLLHTWSLSLEEQFYLFYPILILFVLKSRWSRHIRNLLIVLTGVSLLAAVTHSYELWPLNNWALVQQFSFYSLWTRSWEFLIGGIIALTPLGSTTVQRNRLGQAFSYVGVVTLIFSVLIIEESPTFPGVLALAPVLGTALVIIGSGWWQSGFVSRTLSTRPMVWIGDRSYSLYLWHWPVIVFLNRQFPELNYFSSVAIVLSFVLAALSYSLIEESWRHKIRFSRRAAGVLVVGFLVVPAIIASRLLSNDLERRQPMIETSSGVLDTEELSSCWPENEIQGTRFDLAVCLSEESEMPTIRDKILLIGDSHAGSLIYTLDDLALALGSEPDVASKPSCPLAPAEVAVYLYNFSDQNLMARDDCKQILTVIESWTLRSKPTYTIVAINAPFYIGSPGLTKSFELRLSCFLDNDKSCNRSTSPRERLDKYRPMLKDTIKFLSESSKHVILVAPIPNQYRDQVDLEGDEFGRGTPRAAVDAVREPILSLYDSFRDEFPNLVIWDPISLLCTETFCPSEDLQGGLYSDNTHLSIHGASLLTNPLIDLLKSLR